MTRFILLALLFLTACRHHDGDSDVTDICREDDESCCCPPAGSGIDCMPALSGCTTWMLDSCDVYCASY